MMDDLHATTGVVRCWTDPILRSFRTVGQSEGGVLTATERSELGVPPAPQAFDVERTK